MRRDDSDGLGRLDGETVDWLNERLAEFEDGVPGKLHAVLEEPLAVTPEDGLTVGSAIFRLAVFHELKKTGVLTYDEFQGLKGSLLGW